MSMLLTRNGWLIANGRPLNASIGTAAATTSLTLTPYYVGNTLANPVWSRKAGTENDSANPGGYGDVPVLYTFAGGVPTVEARVVDMDSPATVIMGWADVQNPQIDGAGQVVGTLPGVRIGQDYKLEIRVKGQPSIISNTSTQRWGVGPCGALVGQSNMVSTLNGDPWNNPVPGSTLTENSYWNDPKFTGEFFSAGSFAVPYTVPGTNGSAGNFGSGVTDQGGAISFLRLVGAALSAKYGRKIPICVTLCAWNGTSLDHMTPPTGDDAFMFTNSGKAGTTFGWKSPLGFCPGDFEFIMLHQGEAEGGAMSRAARLTELKAFYNGMLGIVAHTGRTAANLAFIPAVLGVYEQCPMIENIRGAVYDLEDYAKQNGWPKVRAGWNCIDLDTVDSFPNDPGNRGIHFTNVAGGNSYAKWSHRRMVQDALEVLECSTLSGRGPKVAGTKIVENGVKVITGATTRNGNAVTVAITHDGGSTLVATNQANPVTGWFANTLPDFSGTDITLPPGSVTLVNGVPVVAFPAGTVFPCYLKHQGGLVGTLQSQFGNPANLFRDNVGAYPTGAIGADVITNGFPLQPTPDPIKVT